MSLRSIGPWPGGRACIQPGNTGARDIASAVIIAIFIIPGAASGMSDSKFGGTRRTAPGRSTDGAEPSGLTTGVDQWACGVKHVNGAEGTWRDAEDGVLGGNAIAQTAGV
jgi:hypothetical protein